MTECPFCRRDPFHYVDNGVGMEAVAVTCCDLGDLLFRGERDVPDEVTISWDEFVEIANRLRAHDPASFEAGEQLKEQLAWLKSCNDSAHAFVRHALKLPDDAPRRHDYYASLIDDLSDTRFKGGEKAMRERAALAVEKSHMPVLPDQMTTREHLAVYRENIAHAIRALPTGEK